MTVAVWPIALPTLRQSRIGTAWSGAWDAAYFQPYYGDAWNATAWYDVLVQHRMPPDSIYLSTPRPLPDLEYLAAHGANYMALVDACALPSASQFVQAGDDDACPYSFTQAYVDELITTLQPTVDQLRALNISQFGYVYGFDEEPPSCASQIALVFGAVKAAFPEVRTMAALDWVDVPLDLPLDIWVLQYQEYNGTAAAPWLAAGRQQFWYHCIEPSAAGFLNTFIERTLVQARELFWLGALFDLQDSAPSGWLYYAVDLWNPEPGFPRTVMQSLNGTTPFTNFNPANYIWAPTYDDIFANGDGQYLYPGPLGPIATTRLEAIRDGLEDWELFLQAGPAAAALVQQLVRSATDWTEDPALLETVRREVAASIASR